ncbi:MAG: 50S ribosomal protein L17 [Alphaproteobacteria bacterium CG_4_10_14_0_2_um_filter_63_37]|nr:MAG: 50S ribosomal protein L17 [Proteobacteria bacterium CG1_02_64_396]PJA25579.1 MAG: 50S ribosomal protein L17 [Alphaproteobacteria bacterium CG_4_10_14_0_2_um_filter_63_37]
MNHRNSGRKLGRTGSHRRAMMANMLSSLIEHEQIRTTLPKAKELRRFADTMMTLGKRGDLHARRQAIAKIRDQGAVAKLFEDLAKRSASRPGGYTRVLKAGIRPGDAAPMAIIEWVDR